MVAFSRLQLAAALLEYDNDPDDPNPPKKADESAIFSHIRTRNAPRAKTLTGFEQFRETPNLLGVELPINDAASARGSVDNRRSVANTTRTSRASVDMLRNPFGGEDIESERGGDEDEVFEEEEELEVDLEAWGMADFLGNKEKDKKESKKQRAEKRARRVSRAQSEMLLPTTSQGPSKDTDEFGRLGTSSHMPQGTRSKSLGGLSAFNLPEDIQAIRGGLIASEADFRRRTLSGPLDIMGRQTPDFAQRPRPSPPIDNKGSISHSGTPHGPSPLQVPFPSSEQDEDYRSTFEFMLNGETSRFDPKTTHMRTTSQGSLASTMILGGQDPARQTVFSQDDEAFATGSDRASRFDPRPSMDNRRMSHASIGGTIGGTQALEDENPFTLPPPSPTRTSRFDPKAIAYTRTMSDASLGSRLPLDADRMSVASSQLLDGPRREPRPLTRVELLRPKVLIMPSPLQDLEEAAAAAEPPPDLPAGFHKTIIGPPLPPGARATSNSLTPNPRQSLSLAQLTFRNSLMNTSGQRDPAFNDIERNLRRAHEDGEQIYQDENIEEEIAAEQKQAQGRAPGKLYGRSLMDELEARKEKLKSKQRVFTGDQRPSMMSRGQMRRSSTLIDPATLHDRPTSQAFVNQPNQPNQPGLSRRGSLNAKPLLSFSNEHVASPGAGGPKSVFGVDEIWERELQKLKEIEAVEKATEEERRQKEERKAAKKTKKSKKKGDSPEENTTPAPEPQEFERPPSKLPELPPTLPDIPTATSRKPRPAPVDESDSEPDSEASEQEAKRNAARLGSELGGWGSSDDEQKKTRRQPVQRRIPSGDDSEDDVPLVRVLQNPPVLRVPESDSEDEQPLSKVLERKSSYIPNLNFGGPGSSGRDGDNNDDDEDEVPLGVKHPRASAFLATSVAGDEDEDDKPLGLKQMERQSQFAQSQFSLMGQPPMMMMQPQMTGSMVFGAPSLMNSFTPFGMPVMAPPMFNVPQAPAADAAKFASVDRWRRDVAAE